MGFYTWLTFLTKSSFLSWSLAVSHSFSGRVLPSGTAKMNKCTSKLCPSISALNEAKLNKPVTQETVVLTSPFFCFSSGLCGDCCTSTSPAASCTPLWSWTTARADSWPQWAVSLWSFSWSLRRSVLGYGQSKASLAKCFSKLYEENEIFCVVTKLSPRLKWSDGLMHTGLLLSVVNYWDCCFIDMGGFVSFSSLLRTGRPIWRTWWRTWFCGSPPHRGPSLSVVSRATASSTRSASTTSSFWAHCRPSHTASRSWRSAASSSGEGFVVVLFFLPRILSSRLCFVLLKTWVGYWDGSCVKWFLTTLFFPLWRPAACWICALWRTRTPCWSSPWPRWTTVGRACRGSFSPRSSQLQQM